MGCLWRAQRLDQVLDVVLAGPVGRRLTRAVGDRRVGVMSQQQAHQVDSALHHGEEECAVAVIVRRIRRCGAVQQLSCFERSPAITPAAAGSARSARCALTRLRGGSAAPALRPARAVSARDPLFPLFPLFPLAVWSRRRASLRGGRAAIGATCVAAAVAGAEFGPCSTEGGARNFSAGGRSSPARRAPRPASARRDTAAAPA